MLTYFLKGNLPWIGLGGKTKEIKYERIKLKKKLTPTDEICSNLDCIVFAIMIRIIQYLSGLLLKTRV
jgi:hypothetical protein